MLYFILIFAHIVHIECFYSSRVNRISSWKMAVDHEVDVAVIGSGIAGSTISFLLQERHNCKVALIDPSVNTEGHWYPNYGEWRDEWHALSDLLQLPELKECTTTEWEITDCFFGGSNGIPMDTRTTLPRPYVRVDRIKMQALLRNKFFKANGISIPSKLSSTRVNTNIFDKNLTHTENGSILTLDNGDIVKCKVVVDTSGLESKLICKEDPMYARANRKTIPVGFQIAYGFIAHVDSLGPYDQNAMTLFDYKTNHLEGEQLIDATNRPTFMYAMPLGELSDGTYRVFFEETSLVGKDKRRLSFEECKDRALKRLKFHNINILGVEEEEFCYIPMGGELPNLAQRVIAFGGAANMVHPSTGYHACRMLAAATDFAKAIGNGVKENSKPDIISINAYKSIWFEENRWQRSFQVFGGDYLMQQNVDKLRGFFTAFFALEQPVWSGFLAGWPNLPGNEYHDSWYKRLVFALSLFLKMPNDVRISMILFSILHTIEYGPFTLVRSLVPSFVVGDGPGNPSYEKPPIIIGDENAKQEARLMMKQFKPSATSKGRIVSNNIEKSETIPAPFN